MIFSCIISRLPWFNRESFKGMSLTLVGQALREIDPSVIWFKELEVFGKWFNWGRVKSSGGLNYRESWGRQLSCNANRKNVLFTLNLT